MPKAEKLEKVPVTVRALNQRVNRALRRPAALTAAVRSTWKLGPGAAFRLAAVRTSPGESYVIDTGRGAVVRTVTAAELARLARDLGALRAWEVVEG